MLFVNLVGRHSSVKTNCKTFTVQTRCYAILQLWSIDHLHYKSGQLGDKSLLDLSENSLLPKLNMVATQGQFKGEGGATRRWLLAVQKKSHVRMNRPAFRSKIRNQMYAYQRRQLGNFGLSKQLHLKTELIKSLIKSPLTK